MKRIVLLVFISSMSFKLFSQVQSETIKFSSTFDMSSFNEKKDTTYDERYKTIKTITIFHKNNNIRLIKSIHHFPILVKTIYHFDKCGNIRCITNVYYIITS